MATGFIGVCVPGLGLTESALCKDKGQGLARPHETECADDDSNTLGQRVSRFISAGAAFNALSQGYELTRRNDEEITQNIVRGIRRRRDG